MATMMALPWRQTTRLWLLPWAPSAKALPTTLSSRAGCISNVVPPYVFVVLPFENRVDSRAATPGASESFQVSLPEALPLNPDIVMYVNSATCTNAFLPTCTVVGARHNTIYFFE